MTEYKSSQAFFEAKYQREADPWAFASSAYEQARYSSILASLRGRRFKKAFEPGCSIGILTQRLARICERVEAIDISSTAATRAAERCSALRNVAVRQGALPDDIPEGEFDLIVFSEIGYYFGASALTALAGDLVRRLTADGVFLAAHWLGSSPDHRLTGDAVHDIISAIAGLTPSLSQRHAGFRIDRWIRT